LRREAVAAAKATTFQPKSGAAVQYGTITYNFDSNN
jgi:hypothetical protein